MLIHNAQVTGSLILNGIDIGDITGSEVSIGALNSFSASVNIYTGSNNTNINALQTFSSSILTYTSSNDTTNNTQNSRLSSLETTSGSLINASASFSTRVANTETTSSNLTTASSSFSTRVANNEATGSDLVAASASFSTRVTNAESNITSLNSKTGSYATTGSNTLVGAQYISNISNAVSFTSTGSLYTDGGMRVAKDMYVSGTAYFNNVTVFGTQSIAYISSSQLNIGTNIISVNTDTPSIRFGGLAVYDSGSTGLTGSMLWDSEDNQWIYSNPSGSTYDSAVFLVGPRNSGVIGSEVGISCNFLSKGNGMHHMTSSGIFENGSVTCIPNTLIGNVGCFTTSCAASIIGGTISGTTGTFSSNVTADGNYLIANSSVSKKGYTFSSPNSNWGVQTSGMYFNPADGTNATPTFTVNLWNGTFGTAGYGGFTDVLTINGAGGNATFSGNVCAPSMDIMPSGIGSSTLGGIMRVVTAGTSTGIAIGQSNANRYTHIAANDIQVFNDDFFLSTRCAFPLSIGTCYTARLTFAATGVACFACQVCAPAFVGGTATFGLGSGTCINITTNGSNGTSASPLQTSLNFRGYNNNLNGQIRVDDISGTAQLGIMQFYTYNGGQVSALTLCHNAAAAFYGQVYAPRLEILRSSANNGLFVYSNSGATAIGCTMAQINGLTNDSTGNILTLASLNDGIRTVFRNDGNVGIGATAPNYKLEVNGTSCFAGNVAIGGTYCAFALNVHGVTYQIGGSTWVQNGYGYVNAGAVSTGLFPQSDCTIQLRIANSAALTINASNNVGIGTTEPAKLLEIRAGGSNTTPAQIFFGGITQAIVSGEPQIAFSSNISPSTGTTTASELARAGIGFQYVSAALPSEFSIGIQCTNVCNSNVRLFNGVERMRITSTGVTTFTCQVCSPILIAGSVLAIQGNCSAGICFYKDYSGSPGNPGMTIYNNSGTLTFQHNSNGGTTSMQGNVRINGVGNQLTFDTTDGANTIELGTVSDYIFRLRNYRGVGSIMDLGNNYIDFYTNGSLRQRIFDYGVTCFAGTVCAPSFSTPGFLRAHSSMKTFHIQKNLDERLSNSDYFRIASTSGGGFQVIVHSFSQNVGVGWSQSQIFHAVNAPYWGGWVGTSTAVSTIGDGSGVISSAVIGQDGTITFRVSTGNNGTNTQGTINSFIQVNAFNIDGITLTAL